MFKKFLTAIIPISVIFTYVGCSNSPVSVDNESSTLKTAALNSVQMQDIAACGEDIWGLSTASAGSGNYYIYYFNTSTNNWVFTYNYGKKISVTPDGKCYHFNSSNNIWWCKMNADKQTYTNGSIPNPPQSGTMNDISSGVITGGGHSIWVIIGGTFIYKYTTIGGDAGWNNKTDWQTTGDPVSIGCDPFAGESAAIVSITPGSMKCFYYYGGSWHERNSYIQGISYLKDVAIAGAWILLTDSENKLYKNYLNQMAYLRNNVRMYGICGDNDYYYYLSTGGYVYRAANTWN
jgi:hypothetical protein